MSATIFSRAEHGQDLVGPHFRVAEFACKDGSDKILIDLDLVAALEAIRKHVKSPIRITSGYRTPEHNRRVGGERNSYHIRGMAADINADGWLPRDLYRVIDTGKVKGVDPLKIGLGLYLSFVHVDVRGFHGRWSGKGVRL